MATYPYACCLERTFHEGTPKGQHKEIGGLKTYEIGAEHGNDRIIVIATDIYGNEFKNLLLVADELAKQGKYRVLIPDILKGDPVKTSVLPEWISKHGPEVTKPIVDGFLKYVTSELKPKALFGIGYCFGAKYVVPHLFEDGLLTAGAIAHPSFVGLDDIKAITKPILLSCPEHDVMFPEDQRFAAEKIMAENKIKYEVALFSGVTHGYAIKGDPSIPDVKYAITKTISDQLFWFARF